MIQLSNVDDYIDAKLVHSIHTSERRSHRGCRRRHNWIFRDGYYPVVTAKPLEFGVAFHVAMEKLYDPLTWDDRELAYSLAKAAFKKTCEDQFKAFQVAVKSGKVHGFVDMEASRADYSERVELGLGMLRHYVENEMPEHDINFKPVKVEIEFEVPITGPQGEIIWCKCSRCERRHRAWTSKQPEGLGPRSLHYALSDDMIDAWYETTWQGLPVTYGGRIDMLAQDNLGRFWVYDWKTAARLATGEPGADDDFLWLEDQITSYTWAMWKIKFPVAGFVYVEIKKVVPEEPEPLSRPYKGKLYSTNKQAITSTYDQYLSTVKENDLNAYANGLYDDFLDYLKHSSRVHLRHQISRSVEELAHAGHNIYLEALEITDPNTRIYPSPGRFSCNTCAFKDPCVSMNRNEDYQYTLDTLFDKREGHYFERAPSTESKGGA